MGIFSFQLMSGQNMDHQKMSSSTNSVHNMVVIALLSFISQGLIKN